MKKILLVEDDELTNEALSEFLKSYDFEVHSVFTGEDAISYSQDNSIDIVVLDIMLPRINGFEVLKEIRKEKNMPVIILTAICDEETQLKSFDYLADDYLTKPISPILLLKKIQVLLRRSKTDNLLIWRHNGIEVNFTSFVAKREGIEVEITPREVQLLKYLVDNKNQVLSREQILNGVWDECAIISFRVVDNYIKNLRKKLSLDCIKTVQRIGYILEEAK